LICSIYEGKSIDIYEINVKSLLNFCEWLCNPELSSQLIDFYVEREELSVSNVIDQLKMKSSHFCDLSIEIPFISSRLNYFPIESLQSLDSSIFERILSNESFQIQNEDSLLIFQN
jgi:hypothetical protein